MCFLYKALAASTVGRCGFADKHQVIEMSKCDRRKFCDWSLHPDPFRYVTWLQWLRTPVCPPEDERGEEAQEQVGATTTGLM